MSKEGNEGVPIMEFVKTAVQPMIEWHENVDMSKVSINEEDKKAGSPKEGDMIAFNPENLDDQWLVSKEFMAKNYSLKEKVVTEGTKKTLHNTTANGARKNVKDIVFWGDGDLFRLISKASSESEGWMKSTKAMQVGNKVVVQVTTQQRNIDSTYSIAEALTTLEDSFIVEHFDENGVIAGRTIESTSIAVLQSSYHVNIRSKALDKK